MENSDLQLVKDTLDGQTQAFDSLIRTHRSRIEALIFSMVKDSGEAEQLTEEAFVKAFQNLGRLDSPVKFGQWLGAIAVNLSRDFLKEEQRKPVKLEKLSQLGLINSTISESIKNETNIPEMILSLFYEMSLDLQGILALRFFEKMSYAEISDFVGIPLSTVKGGIYRGTMHIRKRLNQHLHGNSN